MRATHIFSTFNARFYQACIKPKSLTVDAQRREYILNLILCFLGLFATLSLILSGFNFLSEDVEHNSSSFVGTCVFTVLIYVLLWQSRQGRYRISSYIFIGLLCLAGLQLLLTYGFALPQATLTFTLAIVISSVLISARMGLLLTAVLVLLELSVGLAQLHRYIHPNWSWLRQPLNFGDSASYAIVFSIIGVITWLSNREIDRSLKRARQSESELAQERDSLEIKVVARTRELEESQRLRTISLQHFAEFGRLSAHLLHEIASPLTAASLNLEQATQDESYMITQVQKNIRQIERYVASARKQLQRKSSRSQFDIRAEIEQVMSLVTPLARDNNVQLRANCTGNLELHGDAVKFSQMIANLVVNAIDASKDSANHHSAAKTVRIDAKQHGKKLLISITDNGVGIKPADLGRVFEPFYSTKTADSRGLGIGLALVKQFVEEDFGGTINVTSKANRSTVFIVSLPRKL